MALLKIVLVLVLLFSLASVASAETIDVQVAAGSDDAGTDEGGWSTARTFLDVGNAYKDKTGMIFRGINIPKSSTITKAYIIVTGDGYIDGDPRTRLYGELSANSAAYSTEANYNSRARTTAYVDWDPNLQGGVVTQSPSIIFYYSRISQYL